jgi:glutathionyl-hydroquinone reductase
VRSSGLAKTRHFLGPLSVMLDGVLLTAHRLFTTMVRFDVAYVTVMNCNWKQVRYDYPNLHRWLRQLYWEADKEAKGAFKSTTHFDIVSYNS